MATGEMLSTTITVAVAEAEFEHKSVAVKVTVLLPKSEHVKAVLSKASVMSPQLSTEPLSMSAVVIEALPSASKMMVTFCVTTVGSVESWMVNVRWKVDAFPQASVAVNVTVVLPVMPHPLVMPV